MADKAITDLNVVPGSIDDNNTWFAVAQSGAAYKVSGHEFVLAMSVIWQSHGGIRDIVYTDPVPPSLTGTLIITLADDTIVSFDVENGKGITSIAKTGTVGLVDTYTITYNDGTTSTFNVTNGAKGDTGDAWYVWIRYAGEEPTQDSDMGTTPDNWMGIYSGTSSTAPVHYTDYDWFQIKGEKGDTGTAATLVSNDIQYQQSDSGSVVPSGSWSATVPAPVAGKYLWTRTVLTFNSGSPVTFYSVARYGIDGTGAVSSVNSVSPDGNGNVSLVANDIPTAGGTSVEADLSGVKNTLTQLGNSQDAIEDAIAFVQDGDTALRTYTAGQFVYLKNHATLAEGLYSVNDNDSIPNGTSVTGHLTADVSGGFNTLKDALTWKGFASTTGTVPIDISQLNAKELLIKVDYDHNVVYAMVPRMAISADGEQWRLGGFHEALDCQMARIAISLTSVALAMNFINGSDFTSSSTLSVYYR